MKGEEFNECFYNEIVCWKSLAKVYDFGNIIVHKNDDDPSHFSNIIYTLEDPISFKISHEVKAQLEGIWSRASFGPYIIKKIDDDELLGHETTAFFKHECKVNNLNIPTGYRFSEEPNLDLFCEILVDSFGFDNSFKQKFKSRMEYVRKICPTRYITLFYNDRPIGISSFFGKAGGKKIDANFLMNLGIVKSEQGKGHGKFLINYSTNSNETIYTRTNNNLLCDKIFPSFGFEYCGKLRTVKLDYEK